MIEKYHQTAMSLLKDKEADIIIGLANNSFGKIRPVFITDSGKAESLVIDMDPSWNLAVYLSKKEVRSMGKPAVYATVETVKTAAQLIREHQIEDGGIILIAVDDDVRTLSSNHAIIEYASRYPSIRLESEKKEIEKIDAMTPEQKWGFWMNEFSKCIKCFACRAACPLCYCPRCTTDVNQPQWISVPAHDSGNLEWHLMRAMHLAGRCTNCGACFRACPMSIPLNLLSRKLTIELEKNFGADCTDPETNPLATFRPDDKENFFR
jgi:ferredoxin